jgi:predicted metal-binding membrane protein
MSGTVRAAPPFAGAYLAIWALAGVVAYALDRPHGPVAAGVVAIAAGAYELTPVKRYFRRRCRADAGSALGYGLCCVGSSIGLMAMVVALDVMSLLAMAVVTVLACAQKLLPAKAAIDVPLALAIVGLGLVIVVAPSLVPGLMPPAMPAM